MSTVCTSEEAVLGNRDLLQRIIRLSLDGGSDATSAVPLHFEHAAAWGTRLLVNRFWKDVTGEVAANAPLSVTFSSAKGLAYASSGRFRVRECHLDLEGRGACLKLLRLSALAPKLASVTLSDWSVVKEEVLQYIQDACAEGAFPRLARMRFRRVVPAQHMLPEQVTAVELADIRPPYGSSPGTGSGLFYLKLANLEALERLEVRYVPAEAYSTRLFAVRLSELLHCKRLATLRLAVPALHDSTDGTVFLSPVFMAQLRACALRELDITLVSDADGGAGGERGQGLARLVQEACKKAGDVFECAYYGPGEGAHADDPRVVLRHRTVPRAEALQSMICRAQASGGVLHLSTDFTKQALFDAGTRAALAASGLPLRLHFGWHMTCEEIQRLLRLDLKVAGVEWFAREARAAQALQAPEWVDPELAVTCLQHVEVRGDERWLPAKFGALSELALRGRPRPQLVPPSCRALTLSFQDGRACTTGLAGLTAVRELRLEHVKVTCLPPALQDLSLIRCRLGPSPQLEAGSRLRSLHIASCTGQGGSVGGGCSSAAGGPLDLEAWVRRARPESLTVTDTHINIGASVTAFADQLALSKVRWVHFQGCTLESESEGRMQQPDAFVAHIACALDSVFSVEVQGGTPYKCSLSRRLSLDVRAPEP